jgi:hypothetical protein
MIVIAISELMSDSTIQPEVRLYCEGRAARKHIKDFCPKGTASAEASHGPTK